MNRVKKLIALNCRRFFRLALKFEDQFETTSAYCDYSNQDASNLIRDGLNAPVPFAVSRFGHSELRALLTYLHIHEPTASSKKIFDYIVGRKVEPWWHSTTVKQVTHNAGLFPVDIQMIEKFCRLTLSDLDQIDVLGSWLGGERWIKPMMTHTKFMRFHDFYHFLHEEPWTTALAHKRILVIHPFAKSIVTQYKLKEKIFPGIHTLPDFDLITYKSIQSIAGNKPDGFSDWFDALEYMKSDISKIEFDIAIIGCGAYGMPLAAFVKKILKRKSIHLGGNTQILFGIKGSRWESDPTFTRFFNEYWVKPLPEETPSGSKTIDENCYW